VHDGLFGLFVEQRKGIAHHFIETIHKSTIVCTNKLSGWGSETGSVHLLARYSHTHNMHASCFLSFLRRRVLYLMFTHTHTHTRNMHASRFLSFLRRRVLYLMFTHTHTHTHASCMLHASFPSLGDVFYISCSHTHTHTHTQNMHVSCFLSFLRRRVLYLHVQ